MAQLMQQITATANLNRQYPTWSKMRNLPRRDQTR
jgi:hypothetical protein